MYKSHILTTPTSIRLLDLIECRNGIVRCSMRVVDLSDENLEFAAISYTWGNPITVHEEPMPDITGLSLEEHWNQLPFAYFTPPIGPDGELVFMADQAKLRYYCQHPYIPREEVIWQKRALREIEVDGNRVPIEENLLRCFEALLELRTVTTQTSGASQHQDPIHSLICLPIWADALCINQTDLQERAAQVKLMGRLYKSANVVLAWIGEQDRLSTLAMEAVGMILDFEATRPQSRDSSFPEQQEVTLSSVPGMTVVHWFAIFALFQRLWFRRAWVVQEAVFAKQIFMICGTTMQTMDLILAVVAFLEQTGLDSELCQFGYNFLTNRAVSDQTQNWGRLSSFSSQPPASMNELKVTPRDAISFMLGCHQTRYRLGLCREGLPVVQLQDNDKEEVEEKAAYNKCRWIVGFSGAQHLVDHDIIEIFDEKLGKGFRLERRKLSLLSVISNFRDLEATDPRDKIFAFLNLAEDDLGLVPDYTVETRDVFIKVAKTMIEKRCGSSLSVLSHVQGPSETRIQGLPSWVPDFSARLGRVPLDKDKYDERFSAGLNECTELHDLIGEVDSDNALNIKAIKVDAVSMSTDLTQDPVIQALRLALHSPAKYPTATRAWCSKGSGRRIRSSQALSRVEALWRTLIIDNLTETSDGDSSLDSRESLGTGFSNWILTNILEAHNMLAELSYRDHWSTPLIEKSFCTRTALWSAMYDGQRLSSDLQVPNLEEMMTDLKAKSESEAEKQSSYHDEDNGDTSSNFRFLPSAQRIRESFSAPPVQESEQKKDPIGGQYKRPSMQRLTPLGRRKLRNFEKLMRDATQGRKLFMTDSGLFGLGPKTLGQASSKDEIWILIGARVRTFYTMLKSQNTGLWARLMYTE